MSDRDAIDSKARPGDGVAVLSYWIHRNMKSGYRDRAYIRDVYSYSFGGFSDGCVKKTINDLRRHLPAARRLGVKLSFDSCILMVANTLQSRHNSFITPMEGYKTCEQQYEDNCLGLLDGFYAKIERLASNISQALPKSASKDSHYAKQSYTVFYAQLSDAWSTRTMEEHDEECMATSYENAMEGRARDPRPHEHPRAKATHCVGLRGVPKR